MKHWSPNNIMRYGFVAVLFLMGLQTIMAINEIKSLNENIANIVDVVNKKISLATEMREFIRLRRFTLARMLTTNDFFKRDELLMQSYGYASKYRDTRTKLTSMGSNFEEKTLHQQLASATRKSQELTREVFENMVSGEYIDKTEEASKALNTVVIMQTRVMTLLDELVDLQKSYSRNLKHEAEAAFQKLFIQLSIISISIFVLSLIVVTVVTRYVTRQNTVILNATRAKSDFLASMSHELRTPLSAVIGFGESLSEEKLPQADIEHVATSIVKAGKHVIRLINDILDISKIEANRMELDIQQSDLFDLIDDLQNIAVVLAKKKELDIEFIPVHPLPKMINTDVLRLKQIVLNLCSNAIKFTQQGKIVLTFSYNTDSNLLSIAVRDPGIGISAAQIKKLFQPFSQAELNTTSKYGGTGLGLYLSQQLAECMGGAIEIQSEPNIGSTFTLTTNIGPPESICLLHDSDEMRQLLEKRDAGVNHDYTDQSKAS